MSGYTTRSQGSVFETDETGSARTTLWVGVVNHSNHDMLGRRAPLPMNTKLELGRDATCFGEGALQDGRISRRHATLRNHTDGLELIDRQSRNGTYINGHRAQRAFLSEGDVVRMGSVQLLVYRAPAWYQAPAHNTLIGVSWSLGAVVDDISKAAPHDTTILVLGETGTGKELVARAIHAESRRKGPLHCVNCAAVPDDLLASELFGHVRGAFSGADRDRVGLIEAANGGTIFLDEIGDASATLQVSLLRFLQEGEVRRIGSNRTIHVHTRVVAATNKDLPTMVANGEFREDLYTRLAAWVIQVPPLRERLEDIPHLTQHFVRQKKTSAALHRRLLRRLLTHSWPGNIRELRAVIDRAMIENGGGHTLRLTPRLEELLTPVHDRAEAREEPSLIAQPVVRASRPDADALSDTIQEHSGNIRAVALELGVSRNTLYRWIKQDGIELDSLRNDST